MELNQDDLPYFLEFVLLDEARRRPSGKRQAEPLKGFWKSITGPLRYMRQSDRRIRWSVCIEGLRTVGQRPVEKAAAEVARLSGLSMANDVSVIRVAYYESPFGRYQLNSFFDSFLHWRKWLLSSDEETIRGTLDHYGRQFGQSRQARMGALFTAVRSDPMQVKRNRDLYLEAGQEERNRIDSNYWDPAAQWQQLATDLWVLGRIHARVDDVEEARALMQRALGIWSTYGARLPDVQVQAIAELNDEIGRLGPYTGLEQA